MSSLLSPSPPKHASFQNHRFEEVIALFKVMDAFEEKLEKEPSIIAQSSLPVIRDFVSEKEALSKNYNAMLKSFARSDILKKLQRTNTKKSHDQPRLSGLPL